MWSRSRAASTLWSWVPRRRFYTPRRWLPVVCVTSSIVLLISLAVAFWLPFHTLFLSEGERQRAYLEVMYRVIADRETQGVTSKEGIVLRLFDFVYEDLFGIGDGRPENPDLLYYLVTGKAWCDHLAYVFEKLLSKEQIRARHAFLRDKDGISPHTVSEVWLGGRWAVFDLQNHLYFRKADGRFATLDELSEHPEMILQHPRMRELAARDPGAYEATAKFFARMFPLPMPPDRPEHPLVQPPLPPWLVRVDWYAHWFGRAFADAYQNLYLRAEIPPAEPDDAKLLFLGRNHQLFFRRDAALREFRALLTDYPSSQYADDALLFKALLFRDLDGDLRHARKSLTRLEVRFPRSEWRGFADRLLGELGSSSVASASGG